MLTGLLPLRFGPGAWGPCCAFGLAEKLASNGLTGSVAQVTLPRRVVKFRDGCSNAKECENLGWFVFFTERFEPFGVFEIRRYASPDWIVIDFVGPDCPPRLEIFQHLARIIVTVFDETVFGDETIQADETLIKTNEIR